MTDERQAIVTKARAAHERYRDLSSQAAAALRERDETWAALVEFDAKNPEARRQPNTPEVRP